VFRSMICSDLFPALAELRHLTHSDEGQDFFKIFLAIKLKTRIRALKLLQQKVAGISFKTMQLFIFPLVNLVLFGGKSAQKGRRNTVSYNKDERRQLIQEALMCYQQLAAELQWSDYYKLLKKLVHKLSKASKGRDGEEPEEEGEKITTKCVCMVLHGFHLAPEENIQSKLGDKVLPVLQKHLISSKQQPRPFVADAIA